MSRCRTLFLHTGCLVLLTGMICQPAVAGEAGSCQPSPTLVPTIEHQLDELLSELAESAAAASLPQTLLLDLQARAMHLLAGLRSNTFCSPATEPDTGELLLHHLQDLQEQVAAVAHELHQEIAGLPGGVKSGTGAIAGTITKTGTGAPIADVVVRVFDRWGNWVVTVSSDSAGHYSTPAELSGGTYYLRTYPTAHIAEIYDDLTWTTTTSVTEGAPVLVTQSQTTTGIDLVLTPGGAITGTVSDADTGLPLAGIKLTIHDTTGLGITSVSSGAAAPTP